MLNKHIPIRQYPCASIFFVPKNILYYPGFNYAIQLDIKDQTEMNISQNKKINHVWTNTNTDISIITSFECNTIEY